MTTLGKRVSALLLVLGMIVCMPTGAFALGFYEYGGWSDTNVQFGFLVEDSVLVTNNEVQVDPDLDEVWAESELYIPIGVLDDDTGEERLATDKQIKDNSVTVSYKATTGSQYVGDVTIVNGKKAKKSEISSGAYAKVTFTNAYTGVRWANIDLMLVLSVNKRSCQETRINLVTSITNHAQDIDTNSVYTVRGPSQFDAWSSYNGEVTFDFGDKVRYTARVARNGKYYLDLDKSANETFQAMYPGVHLEFYNFRGDKDTFASVGKLELPIDRNKFRGENGAPQLYVYEVQEGKLQSLGKDVLTYDSKTSTLNLRTQTLGEYVLANRALMREVSTDEEDIIKTGYYEDLPEDTIGGEDVNPTQTGTQPVDSPTDNPTTGGNDGVMVAGATLEEESAQPETGGDQSEAAEEAADEEEQEVPEEEEKAASAGSAPASYVYTAPVIRANNVSSHNPPTGGGASAASLLVAMAAAAAAAFWGRRGA